MDISESDRKIIKKEIYSATVEAQTILENARRDAEKLVQEASDRRDEELQAARQEGYEEGLTQWNAALADSIRAQERVLKDSEQAVVRLAVRIAEKIIGEQLLLSPTTIVDIVREGLKSIRSEKNLFLKVNPAHVDVLRQSTSRLQDLLLADCRIKIIGDPAIAPGGCIVESEIGVIDAQLDTQLKCLEGALLRAGRK